MPFNLRAYGALKNGVVVRWTDDPTPGPDETILPVVQDPDPALTDDETLEGPDFEIQVNQIRAYGTVAKNALGRISENNSIERALALALFDAINEIRTLKGQGAWSLAQFKAYMKTKLT